MAEASTLLFDGLNALHGGPLDDASGYVFYRELYGHLDGMVKQFGLDLFGRMLAWISAAATMLLTLWLLIEGYRILIGHSQRSMTAFVTDMLQAVMIATLATGSALGGSTLYDWVGHDFGQMVHHVLTGQDGDVFEGIDRTLGYMQLAFGFIDEIQTGANEALEDDKLRNLSLVALGMGGPAIVAGALLLMYKVMLALCLGFAPLFVLCLLFPQTKTLFWNWLNYLVGTLFALSVLHVMAAIATDMICAVAVTFWTGKLTGATVEGVNSLAMQQGGLGLLLTTLIMGAPAIAAKFFKGLLGNFNPYSVFGSAGAGHSGTTGASRAHSHTPAYASPGRRLHTPMHAHRAAMPARATAQEDRIKPTEDTRSFLERYPNATAALNASGGPGDPLPEAIRAAASDASRLRVYSDADIQFVMTERMETPSGGYLEKPRFLEPGSGEYEAAKARFGSANLREIANAVNTLGEKLARRGDPEEIRTFNNIRSIAVEVNPGHAHGATYSAKAHDGAIYINPEIFADYSELRQANRMAHEFRHLMKINQELTGSEYAAKHSPAENDAEEFAKELFGKDSK
ncbi:type IV secretion system protein [Luteimonas gilva]|uniref:Type IV secretion system protein n=1 Tax=Luteimonas gilva TaxID=2572684 RepID=A0A4U5JVZ8_9GAMM|nr:type IV secretion system protein [Luteimonas gilva]TKR30619.1 type IV secretion system protein [Luteimonas gilva]